MRLIKIPDDKYYDYRLQAMFDCYKWDPQFFDSNTLSKYVLVLTSKENNEIIKLTENLDKETRLAEEYLNKNIKLSKKLALPKKIIEQIPKMQTYDKNQNIRLMRYDFHPSTDGNWVVTEVNSDVPGGFAESSLLPDLARKTLNMPELEYNSFGEIMVKAINSKLNKKGTIMMVHCTCFSDDRQVMQYMGDRLHKEGYNIIYGAADHVNFKNKKAYCILDNNENDIDLIFRFTPLEWLIQMKPRRWDGYFNTITKSCNHPIGIYAQSKRFPFVWDDLEKAGISMETWRSLLPETLMVKDLGEMDGFSDYNQLVNYVKNDNEISNVDKNIYNTSILYGANKFPQIKFLYIDIKSIRINYQDIVEGNWIFNIKIDDKFNERNNINYEIENNEHILESKISLSETILKIKLKVDENFDSDITFYNKPTLENESKDTYTCNSWYNKNLENYSIHEFEFDISKFNENIDSLYLKFKVNKKTELNIKLNIEK